MTQPLSGPDPSPNGKRGVQVLRVAVADGDPAMRRLYEEALPALGHQVCTAGSGRQAVELCRAFRPDLLITELKLPDGDGLGAAAEVCRDRPLPVVVVSESHAPEAIGRTHDSPVLAHLVKPVDQADLGPALAVAVDQFERLRSLRQEVAGLRQALEDRKVIERAKGMVMRYGGLSEEEAFRRLRKLASEGNRKLIEVAHEVVTAGEVFRTLEQQDGDRPAEGRAGNSRNGDRRPMRGNHAQ